MKFRKTIGCTISIEAENYLEAIQKPFTAEELLANIKTLYVEEEYDLNNAYLNAAVLSTNMSPEVKN